MYFIHEKKIDQQGNLRLICEDDDIKLAGCTNGIIIKELKQLLRPEHNPPCAWKIPIRELFARRNLTILIDIKPNNSQEIVLCEIDTVFGYSYHEWTPVMFRLIQLFNDEAEESFDKYDFKYPDTTEIVYTMSYFSGSFKNGELSGTWNWPGKSSTNSLMLFPAATAFFHDKMKQFDPEFITEKYTIISF